MLEADVAAGHTLVLPATVARSLLPGLVVSPVSLVPKSEGKWRRIHDLTFAVGTGDSVNSSSDKGEAPPITFGHAFDEQLERIYRLRLAYPQQHIFQYKCDTHSAFRQLRVDPHFAHMFAYRLRDLVAVELRLTFGWCLSPA